MVVQRTNEGSEVGTALALHLVVLVQRVERVVFRIVESDAPKPGPGEFVVKNLWLSLDPYMRGRMNAGKSYVKHLEVGDVMTGGTVGEVIESNHPKFRPGDTVFGFVAGLYPTEHPALPDPASDDD